MTDDQLIAEFKAFVERTRQIGRPIEANILRNALAIACMAHAGPELDPVLYAKALTNLRDLLVKVDSELPDYPTTMGGAAN